METCTVNELKSTMHPMMIIDTADCPIGAEELNVDHVDKTDEWMDENGDIGSRTGRQWLKRVKVYVMDKELK